jgi:hypothetical protein
LPDEGLNDSSYGSEFFSGLPDAGSCRRQLLGVLCMGSVSSVICMNVFTVLALLAMGTDIRRLIQFRAALGYVSVTDLIANVIRTAFASVESTTMKGSIFANIVSKAIPFLDAVILAFWSETIYKPTMITHFSGDGRS